MSTKRTRIGARKPASLWWFLGAVFGLVTFLVVFGPGCGGSGKKSAERPDMEDDGGDDEGDESAGDELMPEDKLDEIQRYFDGKRTVMTRCFTSAIDNGEIPKNATGQVNITVTITPSGKVKNVRITDIRPRAPSFERCIKDTAGGWTVTALPKAMDYSHSYGFGTL